MFLEIISFISLGVYGPLSPINDRKVVIEKAYCRYLMYTFLQRWIGIIISSGGYKTFAGTLYLPQFYKVCFDVWTWAIISKQCYFHTVTLMSAAECQRPRNYSSGCCLRPKELLELLLFGFFVWSMPYQLPPPCYP